jgi:DNA mismatch endonuclease, patch repair protein
MADVHSRERRSFNMSRIRNRDTKPEIVVRKIVHRMGFRYRLHKSDLPGKPDLVLVRHGKIINVHGCFFHMHTCRFGRVTPTTNAEFWATKRESNAQRDRQNLRSLKKAGWKVMTIWECETKDPKSLIRKLKRFLTSRSASGSAGTFTNSLPNHTVQSNFRSRITSDGLDRLFERLAPRLGRQGRE